LDDDVGAVLAELEPRAAVGQDLERAAEQAPDRVIRDELVVAVPAAVLAELDLPRADRRESRARHQAPPAVSSTRVTGPSFTSARAKRPASSSKTRSPRTFRQSVSASASLSSRPTPSSTQKPRPIAPTGSPSTETRASLTRCTTARTKGVKARLAGHGEKVQREGPLAELRVPSNFR